MKRAYSIKLGCLVDARDCDYDDCLEYEIVCEVCRHRVYKGVRPGPHDDVHYLSHYAAQSAEAKECELRVAAAIAADADNKEASGVGHGQSLRKRLAALRWVLHDSLAWSMRIGPARKLVNGVPPIAQYRQVRAIVIDVFRKMCEDMDDCRRLFEDIAARTQSERVLGAAPNEQSVAYLTKLGQRTQVRWSMDMLRTILLKESLPQLITLADFAWAFAIELTIDSRNEDAEQRTSEMVAALLAGLPYRCDLTDVVMAKFHDRVVDHDDRPGLHDDDSTIGASAIMRVRYEMMRLLFLIDYTAPLPRGAAKAIARERSLAERQARRRRRR